MVLRDGYMANRHGFIASSSEETTSSSVSFLRLRSDLKCMDTPLGIEDEGAGADGIYRAYDTVTDRIWDSINKGVGFHFRIGGLGL